MAEQANKSTKVSVADKNNANTSKFAIIGIAVVAVIAIVVAIVVALKGNPTINDDYFVSDGSKYVLNIDGEEEDDAVAVHVVYYYSGDKITGAKSFYEFEDEATAKAAYDELKASGEEGSYSLNGKYVVITADDDEVKEMTVDEVKEQIEFYESLNDLDLDLEDEE